MRLTFRLYKRGMLVRTETHTIPALNLDTWMEKLCVEHAELLTEDDDTLAPHMIEIEFLDEPDPLQRFFRVGTDASGMLFPLAIDLTKEL